MARISLLQSAALAVLATFGAMAPPAQAHPEDEEPDRQEARAAHQQARDEQRGHQVEARQQEATQEAASQPPGQPSEAGRSGDRGDGGQGRFEPRQQHSDAPQPGDGGWRSQHAPDDQRYGRNWDNNGAVSRPAPAYHGETAQVPDRGSADGSPDHHGDGAAGEWAHQRNRTYSDPNRNGTYGVVRDHDHDHDHDRSTQSWSNRHGGRNGYGVSGRGYRDQTDGNRNYGYQTYGYQNGYNSSGRDFNRWDHNDWRRDTRYDWSGYRNRHRDLYRVGRYFSPYSDYGYSRLSIGFFLSSGLFGQSYWINDPWQYRLPQAYGPYRWVRYYDDVLLVDIYSGEVVDVIHDFFW